MRRALILVIALAALPAAPAAAWQEVPFRILPGGNTATCLRATGADGGLAAVGPLERRATPLDLLAAGTGRPAVRERVRFPIALDCAAVREQGGTGVVAAPVVRPGTHRVELRAAVREQGRAFGTPVRLGRAPEENGAHAVAVSARGDALVAWIQETGRGAQARERIAVVRRAPGAPFGPVEALTAWRPGIELVGVPIAAALDQEGRATVAWTHRDDDAAETSTVQAAGAPANGAFAPAQLLTRRATDVGRLSLAVAAGGAALLAHDGDAVVRLFERASGAPGFGPARELGTVDMRGISSATEPALALRDDGAAVIAWREGGDEPGVRALTRLPGREFGPQRQVAPARRDRDFGGGFIAFGLLPDFDRAVAPADAEVRLRAVLSDTGRVALAWTARRGVPDAPRAALGAAGTLQDGFGAPVVLGSPARAAAGVAALLLPGGEPAVAWVDNASGTSGFGFGDFEDPAGGGRIHLAHADAAAEPPAPAPQATLRARRLQTLFTDQPVRLKIRCAAACDVRAFVRRGGAVAAGVGVSAQARRWRTLVLRQSGFGDLLPRRAGRITVRARISAPGSTASRVLRLRVRVARRAVLPVPRLFGARAIRRGRSILVSWRTEFPARQVRFFVRPAGKPAVRQDRPPFDLGALRVVPGRGRTRFAVRLRPEHPDAVRGLVITATDREGGGNRKVTVPVTR